MKTPNGTWLLVMAVGVCAGYGMYPRSIVEAQRTAVSQPPVATPPVWQSTIPAQPLPVKDRTLWPNQPAQATYWAVDDIKKVHQSLVEAERSGKSVDPNTLLHDFPFWTRTHSLFLQHVSEKSPGEAAQQHLGYAQFIVIIGGTGSVIAGGSIGNPSVLTEGTRQIPGELRGRAISGGETFQLTEGDMVSIPPNVPTRFVSTQPGGLTYMVAKVNAMLYPWDLIR